MTSHGNDDNAVTCHRRAQLPVNELKAEIIGLFLSGESVNHTTFLIDYTRRAGDVCDIIREELKERIAASGPFDSNERSSDEIIAALHREIDTLTKQVIYSCSPDRDVHFVQGDKAHEVCDPEPVTAEYVQRLFDYNDKSQRMDNVWLTKDEALILQKLLRGYVVGPAARAVLDKINAVQAG